ncbi:hypothetical protein [Paracoccus sp. ME4]|uniref:hypothetical protein n=1 Tax=Paracoccus sp. ME4 TaxID=3138066 RepID=UPI00398A94BA
MRERKARQEHEDAGERAIVTDEDLSNLDEFSGLVQETVDLLRLENDALRLADTGRVAAYFRRKQELLRLLTIRQPMIEPQLKLDREDIHAVKVRLRALAEELRLNANLIAGVAAASHTILSEVDRIRKRQSLEGVYDKTGRLRKDLTGGDKHSLRKI